MSPERFACWAFTRASSLTAVNTWYSRASFHEAAIAIVIGNTVAKPFRPTPCSASFHHWNWGMPNRGMAGDESIISLTFSSSVKRPNKSSARCSAVRFGFWYGNDCAINTVVVSVSRVVKSSFFINKFVLEYSSYCNSLAKLRNVEHKTKKRISFFISNVYVDFSLLIG